jgi:hypothetical protein
MRCFFISDFYPHDHTVHSSKKPIQPCMSGKVDFGLQEDADKANTIWKLYQQPS